MTARAAGLSLALLLAALPAAAQQNNTSMRGGTFASGRPSFPTNHTAGHHGFQHRTFTTHATHGFGIRVGFPVFGLGFDAHHFHVINGGFGQAFVTPVFVPVGPVVTSTVVVISQPVPVQVPVVVPVEAERRTVYVPAVSAAEQLVGTPRAEERVRVVRPGLPGEPPPAPRLTLLVFKNHSIYAVTDYWLEAGQLHYVTSYGGRNAVALEQIDLEMTVRLNWERGVEFVLRPPPAAR